MRVLHLLTTLDRGGAENQVAALCRALAARGRVEPMVAYLKGPGELAAGLMAAGIPVARLGAEGTGWPAAIGRAISLLRDTRPDIVHTHLFKADLLGTLLARRCGARALVSTKHNEDPYLRRPIGRWMGRRAAHRADRVVAISSAVESFLRSTLDLPDGKVAVIRYGLDPDLPPTAAGASFRARIGVDPGAPLAVAVARLTAQKGLDALVDAAAILRSRIPDLRVALVGRGEDEASLRARVRSRGLGETVLFADFLADPAPAYAAADVVVLPSRWEGFGLAALEAMAAGRPVVASAVGGLPEVLGETGRLVPPGDAKALAEALAETLSESGLAEVRSGRAGESLRERVRREFPLDRAVEAHEALYAGVLGLPAGTVPPAARRRRSLLLVARAGTGGAARHLRLLLEHLDRTRFEPTVAVSPVEDPGFPATLEALGARVVPVPMARDPAPFRDLAAFHAIRSLVRSGEFDLVHAHASKPGAFARLAAARGGPPVVYTPHGWYFEYAPSAAARALFLRAERRFGPRTAILHCVCEGEAEAAAREGLVPPDRIRVVPNAVPPSPAPDPDRTSALRAELGITPGETVVLMAARLAPPKDPLAFLAAAAAPGAEGARFLLAGSGPLLEECRAASGPRALVLGERSDVPDLLALADLAVLSTRYDACPYFALEAAATGKPVVAPPAFVPRGLAPGLVPFDPVDPASLPAALAGLLAPAAAVRRVSLGAAARAAWEASFSPTPWIRSLEEMYEEAVTSAGTAP